MAINYRWTRGYENFQIAAFAGVGSYGIPAIQPLTDVPEGDWIGFNYVRGCDEPEKHVVHFYLDDYQFSRVWARPEQYGNRLREFSAVCSPDFSLYSDMPLAMQERLQPSKVMFYGTLPKEIPEDSVVHIGSFVDKWRRA